MILLSIWFCRSEAASVWRVFTSALPPYQMQAGQSPVSLLCGRVRQTLCFEVHHKGLQLRFAQHSREEAVKDKDQHCVLTSNPYVMTFLTI